ncbi:unnamed protein product [Heligmosomoides polygyrus]|uniref:Uncharacterized protein n=1 Tax=Heligmosomoides polygyrus TaxID=6339 RepID=A0A183FA41_HELPZ|nr:unnamed protein product [Heligmosomoides polygyrus]
MPSDALLSTTSPKPPQNLSTTSVTGRSVGDASPKYNTGLIEKKGNIGLTRFASDGDSRPALHYRSA